MTLPLMPQPDTKTQLRTVHDAMKRRGIAVPTKKPRSYTWLYVVLSFLVGFTAGLVMASVFHL